MRFPAYSGQPNTYPDNQLQIASTPETQHPVTPFMGLAPFLRQSIAGADLRPVAQELLARAGKDALDTPLWMNLSVALQCIGQRDTGMTVQSLALQQNRIYRFAAAIQPPRVRLLMLAAPGDVATNTPLDCLLEDSDIELIYYYVMPDAVLADPIPEHDAVFVAIADGEEHRAMLNALERALAQWPKPVINAPHHIPTTGRDAASRLLQDAPGLFIPPTLQAARASLQEIAAGKAGLSERFPECDFPIIVRPVGSQAGRDLAKVADAKELAAYLDKVAKEDFYISRFIDYSGKDGLFRKFRVALVDGAPYASHMGISANWMVHYVNAGMYEDAAKRAEEARFMEQFDDFAKRHQEALQAIYQRTGLDYVCIDCAELADGRLLVFEIDHTMVVHAMDPEALFPYKQVHMLKVKNAFREYLFRLTNK